MVFRAAERLHLTGAAAESKRQPRSLTLASRAGGAWVKDDCLSSPAIPARCAPAISDSSESPTMAVRPRPASRSPSTMSNIAAEGLPTTTSTKDVPLSLVTTTKTRTFSLTATDLPLPKRRHCPEKCQVLRAKPLALRYSQRLESSLRSDLACRSQASMPRRGATVLMGVRYTGSASRNSVEPLAREPRDVSPEENIHGSGDLRHAPVNRVSPRG